MQPLLIFQTMYWSRNLILFHFILVTELQNIEKLSKSDEKNENGKNKI